jgi:hypothetical protein
MTGSGTTGSGLPAAGLRRARALPIAITVLVLAAGAVAAYFGLRGGGRGAPPALAAVDAGAAGPAAAGPAAPPGRGTLRVATDVDVARFLLDGKNVAQGKTAVITDVVGGVPHELRAEAEGRPPKVLQVLVAAGGESVVEVKFLAGAPRDAKAPPAAPRGPATPRVAPATPKVAPPPPAAPKAPPTKKPGRDDTADPFAP